jgi:hypothetical protein
MSSPCYARLGRQFVSLVNAERALLVCIVLGICLVILPSVPLIISPHQIDYGEGLMLDGALRIRHSLPLYPNPFAFPIVLHVYGPVAYAAAASALPSGGASFPAGRLLILMCSVMLSLFLGTILRRLTGSWWIGLSFGLLLLTLPAFRFWLYLLRADVIGVLFSVTGITLYLLIEKYWYWSIPFFGLALFCKYSLLAAPVAVFIHLILNRKVKQGCAFALGLGAASTLAFMVLQNKTGGWFAFHMFSTHPDRYSLMQFFALAALVLASAPVVTALAALYVTEDFRGRGRSFPPIYLAASGVTALTAGKLGSTTNHFAEWMVACCICAGLGYSLLLSKHAARAVPMTVLLSASVLGGIIAQDRSTLQASRDLAECGSAYQYVSNSSSSRVLSESLGPLIAAGKPILVSDPFVYDQFIKHGLWPDRQVEELVNERYFGLIIMSHDPSQIQTRGSDVWLGPLATDIKRNYRTVSRFNCRDAGVVLEPVLPNRAHEELPDLLGNEDRLGNGIVGDCIDHSDFERSPAEIFSAKGRLDR